MHKWADAVCRTLTTEADSKLEEMFQLYLELMTKSQEDDGYIYTFNQINFPGRRWENLLVEHELYSMGHFIEAGIEHAEWYDTACCPSNISRLLGSLHRFVVQEKGDKLYLNLYFGGKYQLMDNNISLNVQSFLPCKGSTIINVGNSSGKALQFYIRIPGWVDSGEVSINGEKKRLNPRSGNVRGLPDFEHSRFLPVELPAGESSEIRIFFEIPIKLLPADDRVRENRGRLAVYRGPILYCLEYEWDSVEKTGIIKSMLQSGETVRMIPYLHWGNSDDPKNKRMRVWLKV